MWPFGRSKPLGRHGEQLARQHLAQQGMKILARNYRCPSGEIDLIALDSAGPTLVFAEVKTRRDDAYTDPEAAVDADKRRRIKKAAAYYLARHDCDGYNVRFDVVSVVIPPGSPPRVKHIPDAFQ
jgi:putative endonuclease